MFAPRALRLIACLAVWIGFAKLASGSEILIANAKSEPESVAVAPDGTLFAGSARSAFVYRVRPGSTTAETFVDASADGAGTFFFGMLVDASTKTLWACELTPFTGATPVKPRGTLRGFDLKTGAQKLRWSLPGANSVCNDLTIGADKALYLTDTLNGRIYKLTRGATKPQLFFEDTTLLKGIDGITFLGGKLYVTNVFTDKLYRIPVDAGGKAGQAVEITTDQPVKAPDGMRAARGKLLLADSGNGKIEALTIKGDTAAVTVLKDGLNNPTAVEPAGNVIWVAERGTGRAVSILLPN